MSDDQRRYLARGGFDGMPNQHGKTKQPKIKVFMEKNDSKPKAIHEKDVGTSTWQWFQRSYEEYLPGTKIRVLDWQQAAWAIGNSSLTAKKAHEAISDFYSNIVQNMDEGRY